jgi:threonine synthase
MANKDNTIGWTNKKKIAAQFSHTMSNQSLIQKSQLSQSLSNNINLFRIETKLVYHTMGYMNLKTPKPWVHLKNWPNYISNGYGL